MELKTITGIIKYDPVAYAIGSRKISKIRPFLVQLFNILNETYPSKYIYYIKNLLKKDTELLTRLGPQACHPIIVNNIYNEAFLIENKTPELNLLLENIRKALIITTQKKNWAIVHVGFDVIKEARETILKDYGQKPAISSWGPHVTFIREEFYSIPRYRDGETIEISYNTEIKKGKKNYFFFDVVSEELEDIRKFQNLNPNPKPDFHLTIGCITQG
jgi:hypothetical protein